MNSVMDGSLPFLALIKLRLLFTFIFVPKTHLMLRYKVTVKVRVCGWKCKHLQTKFSESKKDGMCQITNLDFQPPPCKHQFCLDNIVFVATN